MKLTATVIIKSDYHGEMESDEEIIQGFIDFITERINLDIHSIKIEDTDEN